DLAAYNKWLASRRIPDDKPYVVIAPVPADQADVVAARANVPKRQPVQFNYEYNYDVEADARQSGKYPDLKKRENGFYTINGKPGIQARTGDNAAALAARGEVSLDKFLKYNDLQPNDVIFPGQVYYLKKKRNKGKLHFHTYIKGQTLWQVSQKYGVKLKALRTKNRIAEGEQLQHGRVLWLRFRRPADKPVEIRNVPKPGAKTPAQTVIAKKGLGSETETMTKQPPVTDAGGQIPEKPRTVPVPTQTAPVQPKVDTTRPVANPPVTEPGSTARRWPGCASGTIWPKPTASAWASN
ncbi:MAG: LysM peptidoglycan-binding domain-containing protein, partial [Cytophagales bacterium]|nr:LysM peptidoglycan-binding domain-containing protein [Cytophagales bacterium]